MEKKIVLRGLDHFGEEELKNYWKDWNPKKDEPKILGLGLSCSFKCNLKCIYCYVGKKIPSSNELTLEEQINLIDQGKKLGTKTVILCGDGDPSMDKNLLPMVKHAHKLNITMVVVTNAVMFGDDNLAKTIHNNKSAKEVAQFLYDNGTSLVIKMDSITPEIYDNIVGIPNCYKKFKKAIENIKAIGFNKGEERENDIVTRVSFSAVVMKNTIDEIPKMKEFADNMGAQFICKVPSLVGNALDNLNVMFSVDKYEEVREYFKPYTAKRETLMVDVPRCMAWHYGPVIDIKGEVRECYTSPCDEDNRIGNIRETSLRDLMKKRNQIYDVTLQDYCPVKTRINKEFTDKKLDKIWKIEEEKACISMIN